MTFDLLVTMNPTFMLYILIAVLNCDSMRVVSTKLYTSSRLVLDVYGLVHYSMCSI